MKRNLCFALLSVLAVVCCAVFVSCGDEEAVRCACGTNIVQEKATFSDMKLLVLDVLPNKDNDLIYYNGSYYFRQRVQEDTNFYFVCNPEKIFAYADTLIYDIEGVVRQTSNILLEQMYAQHHNYYEFEITKIDTVPQFDPNAKK
ncbi:MAG: hypothetical protein IJ250_06965 [Bacteroidales bacterium]|nr:hypothetical protein [Bacteroidales bacterium]